jgi:hypothetical protein
VIARREVAVGLLLGGGGVMVSAMSREVVFVSVKYLVKGERLNGLFVRREVCIDAWGSVYVGLCGIWGDAAP